MTIDIEKIRQEREQWQLNQKWEFRKIVIQTVFGAAAAVGTGLAVAFCAGRFANPCRQRSSCSSRRHRHP
jgi:hypothetical protein